jgi:hypothetical protein
MPHWVFAVKKQSNASENEKRLAVKARNRKDVRPVLRTTNIQ